jgi:hypothetical protein
MGALGFEVEEQKKKGRRSAGCGEQAPLSKGGEG